MDSLDLYAKIEPLIGFYDEYNELYKKYLDVIKTYPVKKVLDIGCGNGKFLKLLDNAGYESFGIERSHKMVEIAKALGTNADVLELDSLNDNSQDCIVAIGDVLNYIKIDELDDFFLHVKRVLKKDGVFIADINTLEGFEVADGVMSSSSENKFLSIEANFDDGVLYTDIDFFKKKDVLYERHQATILQYFHPNKYFNNQKFLSLKKSFYHSMFSQENEKEILIFQK